MRLQADIYNRVLIITNSSEQLEQEELESELNGYFDQSLSDCYTIEVSGLNKQEVNCLHDALVSARRPSTLHRIVYQLEDEAARELLKRFYTWNHFELVKKSGVKVDSVSETNVAPNVKIVDYKITLPSSVRASQLPNSFLKFKADVLEAAGLNPEAAATGIELCTRTKNRRV